MDEDIERCKTASNISEIIANVALLAHLLSLPTIGKWSIFYAYLQSIFSRRYTSIIEGWKALTWNSFGV